MGFLVYYLWMGLDPVDAIYLTVVTISTVGYGDINPSQMCVDDEGNDISDSTNCVGLRLFTCLYILFGCGYVFAQLANVFGGVLVAFSDMVKHLLDKLDTTPTGVDTSGDGNTDTQVAGRSVGLSGKARDLTGDGNIDFIEPPTALVYWMQELVPALLLLMIVQVVSAIIFAQLLPEVNFATALYHCFITATTVGYGDVELTTQSAKLFACVHIVVSVSWLAALLGTIESLRALRKGQLQQAKMITDPPKREQIMALDKEAGKGGDGVDKLEFVVGMMMILGVELCGQPLSWDNLRPFMLQFDQFDVSKTGMLSREDLQKYTDAIELVQQANKASAAALSPSRGKGRQWMTGNGSKRSIMSSITGRKTKSGPLGQLEA